MFAAAKKVMPGELVCINMYGGEAHDSPSMRYQKTWPFGLDADGRYLGNALCFNTAPKWSW